MSAIGVDGLWDAFGDETAKLMGAGARYLAALWDAAYTVAASSLPADAGAIAEADLAASYQDQNFVPSLTLDKVGVVLKS
ncbi:hypothetical protein [Oryzifoliimicrobium ureilyticus]|uniref:hypothetical protein n=1 Tax=Oryzifoliimicrobium ureilyticus TaxID=3113724 RepID=UPI0030761D4E